MDPHERARRLIALATNSGATSEEARTAAVAACRLIAKHKLLEPSGHAGAGAHRRPSRDARATQDSGHGRRSKREDPASYRAARTGTCSFCATAFGPTDDVIDYPSGLVDHWHCAKRRAAGQEPDFHGAPSYRAKK